MSAAARTFTVAQPVAHTPTFSERDLPLGWQRCRECGALLDMYRWARTTCPGAKK